MNFRSPYLEWIKLQHFPKYNLGMSGMYFTGSIADLGLNPAELKVNVPGSHGADALKDALSYRYKVPPENILLCTGTSGVNYLLLKTLFSPGDEVLVETPVYDPLPNALASIGARPVYLPRDFSKSWQIDENMIHRFVNSKTRAMILTNLHNPTCSMISDEKLKSLADILNGFHCLLLVDEVYLEFFFNRNKQTSFHLASNIVTSSSLTKAFGLGGLRAGWSFASAAVVEKAHKVYNLVLGSGPCITETIGAKILSDDRLYNSFADKAVNLIGENLPLVEAFIGSRTDISWVKPDGGITCFPMLNTSDEVDILHKTLLDEFETLVIPGKYFSSPTGFRLGYGVPKGMLEPGLANIGKALDALKKEV